MSANLIQYVLVGSASASIGSTILMLCILMFAFVSPETPYNTIRQTLPSMLIVGALAGLTGALIRIPKLWLILAAPLGWFCAFMVTAIVVLLLGWPKDLFTLWISLLSAGFSLLLVFGKQVSDHIFSHTR